MNAAILTFGKWVRLRQFVKLCLVGGSGVIVDMTVLRCLVGALGWNLSLSKFCSAEFAMLSNFALNEVWTFRGHITGAGNGFGLFGRLVKFQAICGAGIGFAVLLLNLFYRLLGLNLYAANLLAILMVTVWSFWMNARYNWGQPRRAIREGQEES